MSHNNISELEFANIKEALKSYLKADPRFKDFDYAGSNISLLLDILAYNTYLNNFYLNMSLSEMFLDSAQLRSSVVSHAKELNYLPRSARAATAQVNITLDVDDNPASITIPRYTRFAGTGASSSYTFMTTEALTIRNDGSGVYEYENATIAEGRLITETYFVSDPMAQRYVISNKNVDTRFIRVSIRETDDLAANSSEYIYKNNIIDLTDQSKVFFLQPYQEDQYEVVFGNDIIGVRPSIGNVVVIEYLVSNVDAPNGISTFAATSAVAGYTATVETVSSATGGAVKESNESIKFYAPKALQIQERAITKNDYAILLRQEFPEINSVSVFGGEELTPPRYGKVIVAIDLLSSDNLLESEKAKYINFLDERSPLTIDAEIREAGYLYISASANVSYNVSATSYSDGEIESLVKSTISTFSENNLDDFNKTLRLSKLSTAIDNTDTSIVSNELDMRMNIEVDIILNTNQTFQVDFENRLQQNPPVSGGLSEFTPTVYSTAFIYNGKRATLQDDGQGKMNIVTSGSGVYSYLNTDAGTVNYDTGLVNIKTLNISSIIGDTFKITAIPHNNDINSSKDKVIKIKPSDISVTARGVFT